MTPTFWHWFALGGGLLLLEMLTPGVVFLWLALAAGIAGALLWLAPGLTLADAGAQLRRGGRRDRGPFLPLASADAGGRRRSEAEPPCIGLCRHRGQAGERHRPGSRARADRRIRPGWPPAPNCRPAAACGSWVPAAPCCSSSPWRPRRVMLRRTRWTGPLPPELVSPGSTAPSIRRDTPCSRRSPPSPRPSPTRWRLCWPWGRRCSCPMPGLSRLAAGMAGCLLALLAGLDDGPASCPWPWWAPCWPCSAHRDRPASDPARPALAAALRGDRLGSGLARAYHDEAAYCLGLAHAARRRPRRIARPDPARGCDHLRRWYPSFGLSPIRSALQASVRIQARKTAPFSGPSGAMKLRRLRPPTRS